MMTVNVGTWHETSRRITHCPSYYAADNETLQTESGDYPVYLTFETGYNKPMPYWLLIAINTTRVSGTLYSGFGGLNFAHTELRSGDPVKYTVQMYDYQMSSLVSRGQVTLKPGFEWLLEEHPCVSEQSPKTWVDVAKLAAA